MTTTAMLDKTALRAECLRLFKDNKMESDERLAIIIADYFAPTLSHDVAEPVAWRWRGPQGGWIYDETKPTGWHSEPVYGSSAATTILALSADNERQRKNTAEAIREGLAAVADMRTRAEASDARARELEADKAFTAEIASKAIKFKLGEIYVESRGPNAWAVTNGSSVWNAFGEWEWEPSPSNRDEEFISRTRLPFRDAWELARSVAKEAGNV